MADVNLATGDTLGFGNASSNGDAIRLVDSVGRTVDTVIYGPDNSDGWLDDLGVATTNVVAMHPADGSLARIPDGFDTDNSAVDFVGGATSSLGLPNPSAPPPADTSDTGLPPVGSCTDAGLAVGMVINEFLSDPAGSDSDLEWVELYNGGAAAVDLSDWMVAAGTSAFSNSGVIPVGTVLDPGMHLVVGQSTLVAEVDVVASGFSLGNAGSNSDAVQLQDCNGVPVDTVVYGDPNDDLWVDDTGSVSTSLAPVATSGMTTGRVTDGVDTDQSAVDFDVRPYPTPGQDNNAPPETCGGPESGIKVNEFNADPDGSDAGNEWVELYHAGTEVIDLTAWSLQTATSGWSTAHTFESGTFSPGEFLVVGGEFVAEADVVMTGSLGNASSNSDGVRLLDCLGFASDTVVYGGPNDDELMDDSGAIATSLAPSPPSPGSLQRLEDGYDTDQSALDFGLQTEPTPGSSNPALEPVICVPSNGDIVLNEFVPDPEGADGDAMAEFVELYNRGSEDLSVAGWGVDVAASEFTNIPAFVIPGGVIIEAGGYFVIGDSNVENADVVFPLSLGNASSSADGLRLIDCEGSPVDSVIYGDDNPDGLIDDKGDVATPSIKPGENQALGRAEDGVDTNAPEDWVVFAIATPGAANELPTGGGGGGDPVGSRGCGCGGGPSTDAPGGSAPGEAGCTTAPVPVGWMWVVILFGLRRRPGTGRF